MKYNKFLQKRRIYCEEIFKTKYDNQTFSLNKNSQDEIEGLCDVTETPKKQNTKIKIVSKSLI